MKSGDKTIIKERQWHNKVIIQERHVKCRRILKQSYLLLVLSYMQSRYMKDNRKITVTAIDVARFLETGVRGEAEVAQWSP